MSKETPVSRDRPSHSPGGCECQRCGCIFVGDESHQICGVCVEKRPWLQTQIKQAKKNLDELPPWLRKLMRESFR